eukprot:gene1523-1100_t
MLQSKGDVAMDIVQNSRLSTDFSSMRVEAHEDAQRQLESLQPPRQFGNIKVLSWGEIDTRSGFHSAIQLWPVGYRCEQVVEGFTLNGIKKQDIICQVGINDAGLPQFHIYNPSTGGTFIASTEALVWRKFNPNNLDSNWNPSFFNLDIELLLEGLPGALDCVEYKLHCERGFGKTYFTEEEFHHAKQAFLSKLNRERRTLDRQRKQSMSKEDIARNAALQKLKEAEEIELAKAANAKTKQIREAEKNDIRKQREQEQRDRDERKRTEAERKEQRKEEERLRKERSREEEKLTKDVVKESEKHERERTKEFERMEKERQKELDRLEKDKLKEVEKQEREKVREAEKQEKEKVKEAERLQRERIKEAEKLQKEKAKEAERQEKERMKQFEKQRIAARKELNSEVRKVRADIATLILQNFDHEEEIEDGALPAEFAGIDLSTSHMEQDISFHDLLVQTGKSMAPSVLGSEQPAMWDRFFLVLSGINLMRQYLGIDKRYTLDDFSKVMVRTQRPADNSIPDSFFEAQLDRIELSLTKLLLPELHTFLELDEREGDPTRKKDKRQGACAFPLNQLTWTELARMIILNYVMSELGRGKDDRQHLLRGSKLPNFRLAKNIVRNIRYQWYLRSIVTEASKTLNTARLTAHPTVAAEYAAYFDYLSAMQYLHNDIRATTSTYTSTKPYPNIFDSEAEMSQKLQDCVASDQYPDVYKRCCLVVLRLLEFRAVENFLWEIDRETFTDYYQLIRYPIYLSSIASKLVEHGYGYDDAAPLEVAQGVFQELKQLFLNCITYNSEYQTIVVPATKMYLFSHRLMMRWLYDADRPPLDQCAEGICLFTGVECTNSSKLEALRCGKCQHVFHYPTIEEILQESPDAPTNATIERLKPFILEPTAEMFTSINEEWHCPFCLQEDTVVCRRQFVEAGVPLTNEEFFFNEWGASASVPWVLSSKNSSMMEYIREQCPYLLPMMDALTVLASPSKTSFHPTGGFHGWTPAERIMVVSALFEIMQATPKALEHLKSIHDDCANIMRMCAKTSFREADFMTAVRDLSGDDAVKCCRALLDGIDSGSKPEPYLQSFLTEGRCLVCNTTTYEEEDEDDGAGGAGGGGGGGSGGGSANPVILCDGCNAEAHLQCLGLPAVPTDAWYCSVCVDRQARRERVSTTVEHVDQWRDKDEEDRLLNEYVNSKIPELARPAHEYATTQCAYCGMSEFEVCSPFVLGQSRAEHDDWVASMSRTPVAAQFLFPQSNCNVNFLHSGVALTLPKVSCPHFPLESSAAGKKLAELYEAFHRKPVVVHQICALHMFQARANRSRHLLRRRRNVVGEKALSMCGISQQPLGYDGYHNEYWKFPFCSDLFVKLSGRTEVVAAHATFSEDQRAFNRLVGGPVDPSPTEPQSETEEAKEAAQWLRIEDLDAIKALAASLGSSKHEQQLRLNLIKEVIVDKTLQLAKDTGNAATAATGAEATSAAATAAAGATGALTTMATSSSTTGEKDAIAEEIAALSNSNKKATAADADALTPVALKLFVTKGVEVPASVVIHEEAAFVDSSSEGAGGTSSTTGADGADGTGGSGGGDEDDEGLQHLSFNTKSKKYFAVGLVNAQGALIKTANLPDFGHYSVVYQIHREGYSQPVATAAISEPWTDHMYYFCTILFKKSGQYTVSFLVEGTNKAGSIRPLIFPVAVHASSVRCGLPDALHRLQARRFVDAAQRQVTMFRRELAPLTQQTATEFAAVKAALVSVYLALPYGAFSDSEGGGNGGGGGGGSTALTSSRAAAASGASSSTAAITVHALEPNGWDSALEVAWKTAVQAAQTPQELMECVLVLEFYLNRTWLTAPNSRLLSALPSAHFAIRAVTLSSVALRVFSIDKALAYEKVLAVPRDGKKDRAARYMNRAAASYDAVSPPPAASRSAVSSAGRGGAAAAVDTSADGRQRRAAAARRCGVENSARARSCATCDARKPTAGSSSGRRDAAAASSKSRGRATVGAGQKRSKAATQKASASRKQEEDEDEDEGDDEEYAAYVAALPERLAEVAQHMADFRADETDGNVDVFLRGMSLLRLLMHDERSQAFWEPVDVDAAPGYLYVDVRLVFHNCQAYNLPGSVLHQFSVELEAKFDEYFRAWVESDGRPTDAVIPLP